MRQSSLLPPLDIGLIWTSAYLMGKILFAYEDDFEGDILFPQQETVRYNLRGKE
jgi:hypothetical protein